MQLSNMSFDSSQHLSDYGEEEEDTASIPASSRSGEGSLMNSDPSTPSISSSRSRGRGGDGGSSSILSPSSDLREGGYHSDDRASDSGSDFRANVSDIGGLSQCSDGESSVQRNKDVESSANSDRTESVISSDDSVFSSQTSFTGAHSASSMQQQTTEQQEPSIASTFLTQAPNGGSKLSKGRIPTDVRKYKTSIEDTDLIQAVKNGDTTLVKKLLESGRCNLNTTDANGRTVLHIACSFGRLGIVRMLLDEDVNVRV